MITINTPWVRFLLFSTAIHIASTAAVASGYLGDDPQKYFNRLLQVRASIKYLHVEWSMTIVSHAKFKQLELCQHEFEGWYDFETGACCVHRHVTCPNDPLLDGYPRFTYDGQSYRVILGDDVLGYELHGLDKHYMADPQSRVFNESTDIRLLGLFPAPFSVLKNFSLSDLTSYVNGPKSLTITSSEGNPIIEVRGFLAPELTAFLEIDLDSQMPIRIETKMKSTGQRRELLCKWKKYFRHDDSEGFWFPTMVRTRTWEDGMNLSDEELVMVKAVDIGTPPSETSYEWKALSPVDGFVVEHRSANKRVKVEEWDTDLATFVEWNPTPLVTSPKANISDNEGDSTRLWLILVNIVVIAGIVVWLFIARRQ